MKQDVDSTQSDVADTSHSAPHPPQSRRRFVRASAVSGAVLLTLHNRAAWGLNPAVACVSQNLWLSYSAGNPSAHAGNTKEVQDFQDALNELGDNAETYDDEQGNLCVRDVREVTGSGDTSGDIAQNDGFLGDGSFDNGFSGGDAYGSGFSDGDAYGNGSSGGGADGNGVTGCSPAPAAPASAAPATSSRSSRRSSFRGYMRGSSSTSSSSASSYGARSSSASSFGRDAFNDRRSYRRNPPRPGASTASAPAAGSSGCNTASSAPSSSSAPARSPRRGSRVRNPYDYRKG